MLPHPADFPRFLSGAAFAAPPHANDNLPLLAGCALTPAELLQWTRRERKRLGRKLAADPGLWNCPKFRRQWDQTLGLEQVTLRQCYGIHQVQ